MVTRPTGNRLLGLLALLALSVWTVLPSGGFAVAQAPSTGKPAAEAPLGDPPKEQWDDDDFVQPDGLPRIGKWMIDKDGTIAHWLGASYEGKHIREPINVIIHDSHAGSPEEAVERLVEAAAAAGYPSRFGHSGGYRGFIGGEPYDQLPSQPEHAFSNGVYLLDNNHGRIFGPAPWNGGYLFIGAFSRERVVPLDRPGHQYESFDRARDDFGQKIDAGSTFSITGFVDMQNEIVDDPNVTTGDHDGRAVLLRAR